MGKVKYIFLFISLSYSLIIGTCAFTQNSKIDSLLTLLKKDKFREPSSIGISGEDTSKITLLNAVGWELKYNNPDTSIILSNQALIVAQRLSTSQKRVLATEGKKGIASSYKHLGVYYYLKSDYPKALNYYVKALEIYEDLRNSTEENLVKSSKIDISKLLGNIGSVYFNQGDYPNALDYYFKALKIDEELGNKNGIAVDLGNIGIVYNNQHNYQKALDYFLKALKIDEEQKNKGRGSNWLGNIGNIYRELGNSQKANQPQRNNSFKQALDYFFKALKIEEELGNKNGIARGLSNIGSVYADLACDETLATHRDSLFNGALKYYFMALKINKEVGRKSGIATNFSNIGSLYSKQKMYKEAYKYIYSALAIDDSIGALDGVKEDYTMLSELYEKSTIPLPDSIGGKLLNMEQMRLQALYYFKRYISLRDTIFSEENKKQLVRKEMNFEFEKKEAAAKAERDKKDAIAKEELKQKEQQRNYFILGFALVALLAIFVFRGYREKQKANEIISEQKSLVEEKQKEILDSIHYAKRIQQSLLPTEKYIERSLKRLKDKDYKSS